MYLHPVGLSHYLTALDLQHKKQVAVDLSKPLMAVVNIHMQLQRIWNELKMF